MKKSVTAEKKSKQALGGLIALAVVTTVGLVIFTVYGARYFSLQHLRSTPALYLTPQERTVRSAVNYTGTRHLAFGYSFQPPWVGVASRIQTLSLSGMVFQSGQIFQVHNPTMVIDWRSELTRPEKAIVLKRLTDAFGDTCCENNYAIVKRILYASPEQLHFLQSAKQSMAIGILLTYKSAYVGEDTFEVFAIRSPRVKGFQLGSPARSRSVRLVMFPEGGTELWIDISSSVASLRQEEIDRIVGSMRRQSN